MARMSPSLLLVMGCLLALTAAGDTDIRNEIVAARSAAIAKEEALGFDPIRVDEDFERLEALR